MSLDEKIDALLREYEVNVVDQIAPMFSVFAEKLLREVADELTGWTQRSDDANRIPEVIHELADRIKHRSQLV